MNPDLKLDFTSLSGQGVKVGVVDSGVDPSHPKIGSLAGSVEFTRNAQGQIVCREARGDLAGHGTACAGLIRRSAPGASLYSLRVLDTSLRTDLHLLAAAIRWAAAQGLDLLNLSLGTTEPEGIADLQAIPSGSVVPRLRGLPICRLPAARPSVPASSWWPQPTKRAWSATLRPFPR